MQRCNISSGSRFEAEGGYSRVVTLGPWIFVSGCSGFDYATGEISAHVGEQTEQTFRNIIAALGAADARIDDIVRVNLILKSAADYKAIAPILRRHLGDVRPTTTAWQAELMDPRMKIEIEVHAFDAKRFGTASRS
jgi:enamine deaminase RidA (YjgF/YER057c/UK114 family)